jgi:hypothetical protein
MRIEAGVADLVRRIRDDQAQVRYSMARWFSLKTDGDGLSVVWPQNHCDGFLIWATKPRMKVW